jgi:hypothetical protein
VLTHLLFPVPSIPHSNFSCLHKAAKSRQAWESKVVLVSAQYEAVIWWDRQGWGIWPGKLVATRHPEGTGHGPWLDFMHILPETGRLVLDDSTIVGDFISSHNNNG